MRREEPVFDVENLVPGENYFVSITAQNAKGQSASVEIDAIRLKVCGFCTNYGSEDVNFFKV